MNLLRRRIVRLGGLLLLGNLLITCVERIQLPIRQVEPRLVVEGLITDEPPPYSVRLSYSGAFNTVSQVPEELTVNGAVVTLSDDQGRTVRLQQDPLAPTYYWMRDPSFRGAAGRRYTLTIRLPDGRTYHSDPELMPAGSPIERLYAEYYQQKQGSTDPDTYEVLLDTRDPATPGNFYRWSAYGFVPRWTNVTPLESNVGCCNSCWVPYYGPPTNVLSDALINGNAISRRLVFSSPVYAVGKQYIEVRQYSITRAAFQFWNRYEQQRTRTGSLFDAQPASIEGNIHREDDPGEPALGYFGASSVSRHRLVITADTLNIQRYTTRFGKTFIPPGNCMIVYPQGQLDPPANW